MIKPYLTTTIHVKSLYTYRDFLKKRPKHTHQFKFTMISSQLRMSLAGEKKVQFQLMRTSKLLKSVSKVDFRDYIIENYSFLKTRLLSVYKRISRAKTLFIRSPIDYSEVKDFKHFSQLEHLIYQLNSPLQKYNLPKITYNYLNCLKYSPKIASFNLTDWSAWHFPKMGKKGRSCLRSLKHISLKREGEFYFPIEFCKSLNSVSFNFDDIHFAKPLIDELPNIPNLQEICLSFDKISIFGFLISFKTITQKGLLKKVKLAFGKGVLNLSKILEALKACQLTHFSLKSCIEAEPFTSLTRFLETMDHLKSFELHIPNIEFFLEEDKLIIALCKQINKLQELRNLKLDFKKFNGLKSGKIANFTPYLWNLFTKPIKVETLSIVCYQLDPSEVLESLMLLLEDSAAFLTHLKIYSRALIINQKIHRSIMHFLQKLSSIQVLEIPCVSISGSTLQFFNEIAEIISGLKYLRVLEIGKIKGAVNLSAFYKTVETIITKKGLRKFVCSLSGGFRTNWIVERNFHWSPNSKRIIEKNPYLETLDIKHGFRQFLDIKSWTEK